MTGDHRRRVFTARWVLPISEPPIRDGAVLVADGRIAAVGPADAVDTPDGADRLDLGEAVLVPGLVNAHAHPELAAFRGYLEDLPFHRWIPTLLAAKRRARLGPDDFLAAARWTCAEALAAGITTLAATEDSGAALHALRDAGMRGIVYREVFGPDPAQAPAALRELRQRVDHMRALETDLVRVGISPHAPYTVSDDLYRDAGRLALELELPLAAHAAEALVEERLVRHGDGAFADGLRARGIDTPTRARSTIALLHRTGVLRSRPLLIHCVRIDDEDIRLIADAGATVAHCPTANARLGHGVAPVARLLDAGVAVGLGTDSVASNNRLDLLEEARTAQLLQRASLPSHDALPPDRLLHMATLGGARALGLDAEIGSLEPGKSADLAAFSVAAPHVHPVHDVHAAATLAARGADARLTVVAGRVLYHDGRWHSLDLAPVRQRIRAQAERLDAVRPAASESAMAGAGDD